MRKQLHRWRMHVPAPQRLAEMERVPASAKPTGFYDRHHQTASQSTIGAITYIPWKRFMQRAAGQFSKLLIHRRAVVSMSQAAAGTGATESLKRKMARIGTHSGTFHCDEALGCFLLKQTDAFKDAGIVRTRDPDVLKDLDVVIDVGGVYDPSKSMQFYFCR